MLWNQEKGLRKLKMKQMEVTLGSQKTLELEVRWFVTREKEPLDKVNIKSLKVGIQILESFRRRVRNSTT